MELSNVVTTEMVDGNEERDGSGEGDGGEDISDDSEVAVNVDDLFLVELCCVVTAEVVDI